MSEPQRRPGTKFVYRSEPGDKMAWLPGGRALVLNPNHPPKLIEQDDSVREITLRDAALLLTDRRTIQID